MLLLMFEMTTPGIARKPTFAVSMTVDWINCMKREKSSLMEVQMTYPEN